MEMRVNAYKQIAQAIATNVISKAKTQSQTQDSEIKGESKPAGDRDTITLSAAGKQFLAGVKESSLGMESMKIVSDLESFNATLESMQKILPVNWNTEVDPFGTIRNAAVAESTLQQLNNPDVSHNTKDMDKVATQYAQAQIDELISQRKEILAARGENNHAQEYVEYQLAYNAYHSKDGNSLVASMSGDTQKAYAIYKNILDGVSIGLDAEKFLVLHNQPMYVGAKSELLLKQDDLYKVFRGLAS